MRARDFLASLKMSAGVALHTFGARSRGVSYVPHPRTVICIETVTHCNLLCSFCTYRLEMRPHSVMNFETFRNYAGQAIEMGFRDLALTPINGDAFMDKGILKKLRFVNECEAGPGIILYTNLIGASDGMIQEILKMDRLKLLVVGIYGHDSATFAKITGRGDSQFRRLLANLSTIEAFTRQNGPPGALRMAIRTDRRWRLDDRPIGALHGQLRRLRDLGVEMVVHTTLDDWGGLIKEADLGGLDMTLVRGRLLFKNGACSLPFYNVQILADGRVNACACRDIRGELVIGDLRETPLAGILSGSNSRYTTLIERQQRGDFQESCKGCSFYRSIYDSRIAATSELGSMSLDAFWDHAGREPKPAVQPVSA